MNAQTRIERSLAVLRDCGPYVLIELLLPGGTLFALLLYLTRRYARGGFASVRQFAARRAVAPAQVKAKPVPGKRKFCLCPGHVAEIGAAGTLTQRCEGRSALAACCA